MPSGSSGRFKEECLHRVVPLGEGHLRLIVHEYVEHYHRERNHQGLDNQLLQRPPPPVRSDADVQRRERLGGLLSFYYRRGRMSGRPINRTLRGRERRPSAHPAALAKAARKRTADDLPVHSFRTLLTDLGTLTVNTLQVADTGASFPLQTQPTEVQQRCFELLRVSPRM